MEALAKICHGNYFDDGKTDDKFFISKGHEQREELIKALKFCFDTLSMPTLYGYLKKSYPRGKT